MAVGELARELLEQAALFGRQALWKHPLHTREQIPRAVTLGSWHALAGEAERLPVLGLGGNGEDQALAVRQDDWRLPTEHGRRQRETKLGDQVVALALEGGIQLHRNDDIEVARG